MPDDVWAERREQMGRRSDDELREIAAMDCVVPLDHELAARASELLEIREAAAANMAPRGDIRIEVWISGISEQGANAIQEKIGDLLVEQGYGCRDDSDDDVLAIVASFAAPMPEPDAFVIDMTARGASSFLIPTIRARGDGA